MWLQIEPPNPKCWLGRTDRWTDGRENSIPHPPPPPPPTHTNKVCGGGGGGGGGINMFYFLLDSFNLRIKIQETLRNQIHSIIYTKKLE